MSVHIVRLLLMVIPGVEVSILFRRQWGWADSFASWPNPQDRPAYHCTSRTARGHGPQAPLAGHPSDTRCPR